MGLNKKKVLFFNAKREKCDSVSPHLGLAILTSILKQKGHEVLVIDYQFKHNGPPPITFIENFNPDVIGVSLYTATMREANKIIDSISKFDIPIVVGGPHATLYSDVLTADNRIDCIVKGPAELKIVNIVEHTERNKFISQNRIVEGQIPNLKDLPHPDFTSFFSYNDISIYPLITSRGCPYNCSFCAVHLISSKTWRNREPKDCIAELEIAKRKLPKLKSITVYDDSPMTKREHAIQFLNMYIDRNIGLPLTIINTRADCLDEKIVSLLKKAKCPAIAIGVEHGHPDIFNKIGKGETLDDIKKAAKLIKQKGISLYLCFVIGFPHDSLEKTKYSINLAKELKPDYIYWNMMTPIRGTEVKKWYDLKGKIYNVENHSSFVDGDFMCDEPCAESSDFSIESRKKAYLMAILETVDNRLKVRHIPRLIPYILKYRLYKEFLFWLPNLMKKKLVSMITLPKRALKIFRTICL